jgi:hypothetical protein
MIEFQRLLLAVQINLNLLVRRAAIEERDDVMPPPQRRRGLSLDAERVVGPDADKIEMQFAVDQI